MNNSRISRALTKVLRHTGINSGIEFDSSGYASLQDVLECCKLQHVPFSVISEIVETCPKQRMSLIETSSGWRIRANQGHSAKMDFSDLYTQIKSADDIPMCIHGTYIEFLPKIKVEGLRCMGRTHIHFACGLPGDRELISGMRPTCNAHIYIDLAAALADGIIFEKSANNVILSRGINGVLPPKYFLKITENPSKKTPPMILSKSSVTKDKR